MAKQNKGLAFLGTIPVAGYIILRLMREKDKYATYYAKQGLALGIIWAIGHIVLTLLVLTILLNFIWAPLMGILWILSVVNAFSGKMKATPLVGKFASRF
jgi:uncharacterized membrane protein